MFTVHEYSIFPSLYVVRYSTVLYLSFQKGGLPKNDPVCVQLGCLARDGALQNRPHEGDELGRCHAEGISTRGECSASAFCPHAAVNAPI